jgi:hypothetical protein
MNSGCSGTITAQEALDAENARYVAQTTDDYAALERLYGDDLVYIHSNALVDTKAGFIELQRSGNVRYRKMKNSDATVRVFGCIAIITARGTFEVLAKGNTVHVELLFHAVWAKRPAGIQFVSWQATGLPKP